MKNKFIYIFICLNFIYSNELKERFHFNQSTVQAFYFVLDAKIYGSPLEGEDWLVVYHNNICIGARQWAGPYTDIPVMGDDGSEYSKGYIKAGEFPEFKIYDSSMDILYNATPSEQVAYPKGMVGMIQLKSLNVELNDWEVISKDSISSTLENTDLKIASENLIDYQIFNQYKYRKPKRFTWITSLPYDLKEYGKIVFNKNYLKEFGFLTLITGTLIYFDEDLIETSRIIGNKLNLSYGDQMQIIAKPLDQPIRLPSDLGSTLYFIGDGWTHLAMSMSFYLAGKITNDNRAFQTSSQILQTTISAGLITQVVKHITGRTSPQKSVGDYWGDPETSVEKWNEGNTNVNDHWDFFPSQIEYHKYVSSYDAFPSGHLAVCMATFTIINENYPEYKMIKPIGYTLMGLLSLQMMNNGVHWASDYPLSIAMGYYLGKIAVNNGRESNLQTSSLNYRIDPYFNSNEIGLSINYYFN